MEEDIKVLEKYINGKDTMKETLVKAIENLIKRNKELEEKVNKYEKQIDLEWVEDNYIEKSKVREKIEKLENKMPPDDDYAFEIQNDIYSKINILQELLEGDD